MARVRAVLRRITRADNQRQQNYHFDNLSINLDDYLVTINQQNVSLTKKEIELLWTLATNTNKVFSRDNLLNSLWGYDYYGDSRTVDSHIKRLRAKLDEFDHDHWEIKPYGVLAINLREKQMKNKIAFKLTMYFSAALLLFSIIIGSVFMTLFRNHTMELQKLICRNVR